MQIQRLFLISLLLCVVLTGSAVGQKNKAGKPAPPAAEQAAPAAAPAAPPVAAPVAPAPVAAAPAAAAPVAPLVSVTDPVNPGAPLSVTGTKDATLSIYSQKAGVNCDESGFIDLGNPLQIQEGTNASAPNLKLTGSVQSITVSTPTKAGDTLCLLAVNGTSPDAYKPVQVALPQAHFSFVANPVAGSNAISVHGDSNAKVGVLQFASSYAQNPKLDSCSSTDRSNGQLLAIGLEGSTSNSIVLSGSDPFTIVLNKPLQAGTQLCLVAQETPAGGNLTTYYSSFTTVQTSTAAPVQPALQFTSELVTGSSTFSIQGPTADEVVSIYLFGAGYSGTKHVAGQKDEKTLCDDSDRAHGTQLSLVGTGAAAASTSTVTISATTVNSSVAVALNNPLVAGTQICLFGSPKAGSANDQFSSFKRVQYFAPGDDYGRFAVNLTGGVMISNQQQASSSSTASQYFDLGLSYTLARAGSEQKSKVDTDQEQKSSWFNRHGPGMATLMDIQLTAIPVAASTSTTTTTSSTSTLSSQSLNVLSSQQSTTVLMGIYFPFRLTHWYHSTNWITAAPLAMGGFNTLLNPTTTTSSSSSTNTGTPTSTTTSNFSSVYNFHAAGARFGWDIYPKRTDEAPIELSWFSAVFGWYSNLPSWHCTAMPGSTPPTAPLPIITSNRNTSCLANPVTGSSPASYDVYESRTLVPARGYFGRA